MVSSLRLLFRVISCFPVFLSDPCFLRQYPCFLCRNPLLLIFHVLYPAWCASGEWGGVPWVAWRHSWPRTCFYADMLFNPLTQVPIPDPSPAPFPTGDWGVEIYRSYVSRTSRPRLLFNRLPTLYLRKGFFPFSCHGSTQLREYDQGFPP